MGNLRHTLKKSGGGRKGKERKGKERRSRSRSTSTSPDRSPSRSASEASHIYTRRARSRSPSYEEDDFSDLDGCGPGGTQALSIKKPRHEDGRSMRQGYKQIVVPRY